MFTLPSNQEKGQINLCKQFRCSSEVQHYCWVYENQQDHQTVLTNYVLEGLKQHEKVVLILQMYTPQQIMDYFPEDIGIASYVKSGQLVMMNSDSIYTPSSIGFVPSRIMEQFSESIDQALKEGFTRLRAYGDMSFASSVPTSDIIKYESELVSLYGKYRTHMIGMCGYPSWVFDSSLVVSMLTVHPKIVVGKESFDSNFYFVPNAIHQPMSSIAEYWISNLRERSSLIQALHQKNTELTKMNAILKGEILEKERAQADKKTAEDANRMRRAFIATLSHEIRTPLFGILSTAALMRDTALSSEQQEYISMIDSIGEHLVTVLNDVLDYSKFESSKVELEYRTFSLKECVVGVIEMFQKKKDKVVSLEYKLSEKTPAFVTGDVTRLRQVLLNLVGNAFKFTSNQGRVRVAVDCGKVRQKLELRFSIEDNGVGIPKDKFGGIFEEYQQTDVSHSRLFGGTGLGLAISKKLVEAMGGQIWFESQEGVGTTFSFTIQVSEAESLPPKKRKFSIDCTETFSLQILVAEDNPLNQSVIDRMLKKLGHNLDMACNGVEAVEMAMKKDYDLILMDFHMPQLTGPEATRQILDLNWTHRTSPRIVALTASVFDEEKLECEESGMHGFIQKPLKMDQLQQVCRETFQVKRQKT